MAQRPVHKVADRWFAQLNASVTSGATTWVLKSNGATGLPVPSAMQDVIVHCGSEKVLVTAIDVDTPSAGLDTLTVERAYGATTAASHAADAFVGHYYYQEHHNEVATRLAQVERFLAALFTNNSVVQDGGLLVLASGSDMTISVNSGAAIVDGQPVALLESTSFTLTAPTGGNSRIDCVRIDAYGNVSVVTGTPSGSPVAPSVGSGYLKRAEILLTTGQTSIVTGDITMTDNYG